MGEHVDLAPKPQPWTSTSPTLIYATAEDAAKWMHFLYHEKIVLNQRSLDQMLDFHSPAPNDPPLSGYGLGVMFEDYDLVENLFGIKGVRMWWSRRVNTWVSCNRHVPSRSRNNDICVNKWQ